MFSVFVQLPGGFIDELTFDSLKSLEDFKNNNSDCIFGDIHTSKILSDSDD